MAESCMSFFKSGSRLALTLCLLASYAGAEEVATDELLREALSGDLRRLDKILERQEELLPAIDAKVEGPASRDEKRMALHVLSIIGNRDPTLVFSSERVDKLSQMLAEEKDQFVMRLIAEFIRGAVDNGRLEEHELVSERVKQAFLRTSNGYLGYLLLRLVPNDAEVRSIVRAGANSLHERLRRALLAAAGDEASLMELVNMLELDNRSQDQRLDYRRSMAIDALRKAQDCRTVGSLVDLVSRNLPFPPSQGDVRHGPLSGIAVRALRDILAAYPDVIKPERTPKTKDEFLEWWAKEGRSLPGLDIRKSPEEVWQKEFPVRPRKEPRGGTQKQGDASEERAANEDPSRAFARAAQEWSRRADALAVKNGKESALEYYREAVELVRPAANKIAIAFSTIVKREKPVGVPAAPPADRLVVENEKALHLTRKGLGRNRCELPRKVDIGEPFVFLPWMAVLGKLLAVQGRSLEEQGRWREALHAYLDSARFSRHLASERLRVGVWTSLEIEKAGYELVRQLLSERELPSSDYAWLSRELVALGDTNVSVLATLLEEADLLRRSFDRMDMTKLVDVIARRGATDKPDAAHIRQQEILADLAEYEAALREWIALPYGEAVQRPEPIAHHWVSRNLLPHARDLRNRRLEVVCDRRATLLLAALLQHKSRTGAFPDSLDSLRLKLEGLPLDPFAEGPFGYIKKGPGCLIYSWGPDADDDKGARNVAGAAHWPEPADGDLVYALALEPAPSAGDSACPVALKPEPTEEGSSRWLWYLGLLALVVILVGMAFAMRARVKRSSPER